jgi:hypothetical protein
MQDRRQLNSTDPIVVGFMVLPAIGATQVRLAMTFDRINDLMLRLAPVLPVLGLPIYLLFALAGKWSSRIAVFLSLSAPGLLILAYDIWVYVSIELGAERHVYSASDILISMLLLNPAALVFPAIFIVQLVDIFRGKWIQMTKSSGIFIALLMPFYFWNFVVFALIRDVELHP